MSEKPQIPMISWSSFEQFRNCPREYRWSMFPEEIKKVNVVPPSDSQHLIRGTAMQGVMDWICKNQFQYPKVVEMETFLRRELTRAFTEFAFHGNSGRNFEQMFQVLRHQIPKNVKAVQEYLLQKNWVVKKFSTQKRLSNLVNLGSRTVELIATLDFLLEVELPEGLRYVVIEGKSTGKPETRNIDQAFFQASLVASEESMQFPVIEAGYLFYSQNQLQMHPVNSLGMISKQFQDWWGQRNQTLRSIIDGSGDPTPGNRNCKFCQFQRTCPDVHVPQKRNPVIGLPSGILIGLE